MSQHFSSSVCPRATVNQFIADTAKDYNAFPANIKVIISDELNQPNNQQNRPEISGRFSALPW
jgi:hypothetical protein